MIPLINGTSSSQIQKNRKSNGGYQGLGRADKRELFNGYRASGLQDEKVLEICLTTMSTYF